MSLLLGVMPLGSWLKNAIMGFVVISMDSAP